MQWWQMQYKDCNFTNKPEKNNAKGEFLRPREQKMAKYLILEK